MAVDVPRDRRDVTPGDVGGHVEVGGDRLVPDHRRIRHDLHVGHIADTDMATSRSVDKQFLDVCSRSGGSRARPTRRRRRPSAVRTGCPTVMPPSSVAAAAPDVSRLDAGRLRSRQVHLDLHGGLLERAFDVRSDHAIDVGDQRPNLVGLGVQHIRVLAVDAHDDVVVGGAQDIGDPLFGVGQHVGRHSGDNRRPCPDGGQRASWSAPASTLTHISPELTLTI